jgi:transmembrane 9 superfamily member 2/4
MLLIVVFVQSIASFQIAGVAPTNYNPHQKVDVNVNALSSPHQLLNYDYYSPFFHFCQPQKGPQKLSESLGSIVFGDRLWTSPYDVSCYNIVEDVGKHNV